MAVISFVPSPLDKRYGVVVVLGFNVPPTVKVICRQDLGLKSHLKDQRSQGLNPRPLVYKASSFTTTPRRLLRDMVCIQ